MAQALPQARRAAAAVAISPLKVATHLHWTLSIIPCQRPSGSFSFRPL